MLRWPFRTVNAMGAYELNEQGDGGYYPVGLNNMWHSGIHLSSFAERPIYPLLNGKLVDHRIRDKYEEVDKKEEITEKTWKTLSYAEQTHYQQKTSWFGNITYELKGDCKEKDLYSNNFVLMSHEIVVNASENEKIKFYTLYMNLAPYNYEEYVDIDINSSKLKIPFYQEWKFLVKPEEDIGGSIVYKYKKNTEKVYDGSCFTWEFSTETGKISNLKELLANTANELLKCKFALDGEEVDIPVEDFEIVEITINLKDLAVYRENIYGESVGTIPSDLLVKLNNTKFDNIIKKKDSEGNNRYYLRYAIGSDNITYNSISCQVTDEHFGEPNSYGIYFLKENIASLPIDDSDTSAEANDSPIKVYEGDTFLKKDDNIFTTYIQETPKSRDIDITDRIIIELRGHIKKVEDNKDKFDPIIGMQEYEYVSGSTLGEPISVLKPDDEFAMVNGDDDFFLSGESKDVVVIQRYTTGGVKPKTVVKMTTIPKGNLKVKSVPSMENVAAARKELTTRQCLGFPGPLSYHSTSSEPLDRSLYNGIYDLMLILEKDLLADSTETIDPEFFKGKVTDNVTEGANKTEPTPKIFTDVESGIISNIIDSDEYVKLFDSDFYYKRDKTKSLAWGNFFQKVTDKATKTSGDIFCDTRKLLNWIDSTVFGDGGVITKDEMSILFKTGDNSDYAIPRSKLRKLICQHPLEWNRSLYSDIRTQAKKYRIPISDEQQTRMQNVANATDIWGKVGAVLREKEVEIENNCLWFAHPIYFVNHLKREGLLDFNPYEGKVLNVKYAELHDYEEIEVKSCPGFAPVYKEGTMAEYDYNPALETGDVNARFYEELRDSTNPNYRWARLSCVFGYSWGYFSKTKNHTGIDFGGLRGSPIISMITGVVWAKTWEGNREEESSGYGKLMIIKDMNNDLLYLLAHLDDYKKEVGEYVYPGETVALVGNTGGSFGAHLHLEVFVCDATEKSKVLLGDVNSPLAWVYNDGDGNTPARKVFDRFANRRNPLDHKE